MIVEKRISFRRLVKLIWRELVCIAIVSTIPPVVLVHFGRVDYAINGAIPLVVGTAIAIFLGFRTNSAYDRWWEARKLWGGIISDSRNLVRQAQHFVGSIGNSDADADRIRVREIAFRQIALGYLMDYQLKDVPLGNKIDRWLSESDRVAAASSRDPALALITRQGRSMRGAVDAGRSDTRQMVLFEETLNRLSDQWGGCQRIKTTVFPVHYQFFTRVFIWIFLVLLGFSLPAHQNASYTAIPAIFLIGWVFFMVEGIGSYMQDPFVNNRNVIPMDSLACVIEGNVLETIGETELPPPVEPIEGAIY